MLNRILATASLLVLAGGVVFGSTAMADVQKAAKERGLVLACGGSHMHGAGHAQGSAVHESHETSQAAIQEGPAPQNQELCPVMGGKVDRSVFKDYEGKRVYFCCPACIDRFMEERDDPGEGA